MPRSPEAQKQAKRERYAHYKELCAEHRVPQAGDRWWRHYAELRVAGPDGTRLTSEQLQQWWRDTFTPDQIHRVGGGMA